MKVEQVAHNGNEKEDPTPTLLLRIEPEARP